MRPRLTRPVPGIDKLLEVDEILAKESPLTLAEIRFRMRKNVRHKTLRDCLEVLQYYEAIRPGDGGYHYVRPRQVSSTTI